MSHKSPKHVPKAQNEVSKLWFIDLLKRCSKVLTRRDRRRIFLVIFLQAVLSALDFLGVIAIGVLGSMGVSIVQSKEPSSSVARVISFLGLESMAPSQQAQVIGLIALVSLVTRSIVSIYISRRIIFFLSLRGANLSADLTSKLLAQPLLFLRKRSSQQTIFALTNGVVVIMLLILANAVVIASDTIMLVVLIFGLFLVDPLTAISLAAIFLVIAIALYLSMHSKAGHLGLENSKLTILSNEKISEVISLYKESAVRGRQQYYAAEIGTIRMKLSRITAEMSFMPYVSKYVLELSVVVATIFIGFLQFFLKDASQAVASIAIIFAAGTRIAPAVLRIQQGTISIRGAAGQAKPTLDLIDDIGDFPLPERLNLPLNTNYQGFCPEIVINDVTFAYPHSAKDSLTDVNLKVPPGALVAFVGPSGSGKTTLIDVLLGLLELQHGQILISGQSPADVIKSWPGAISYVPQEAFAVAGSFSKNISIGYERTDATDNLILRAVEIAQLSEFMATLPEGVNTKIGERGATISGGQLQRLGIARAMFTEPLLLVLDEATSALDAETEASFTESLKLLKGKTTVVLAAHRLSTVRDADIVVYFNEGRILATGTFSEVRLKVPEFDAQARLMGI